jgi:hypothetical protein
MSDKTQMNAAERLLTEEPGKSDATQEPKQK